MTQTKREDKNTPEFLHKQIANGRHSLLLILIFTVINLGSVLLDANTYFLFSASLPYYVTLYGKGLDNNFSSGAWDVNGTGTMIGLAVSAVVLGLLLLCWVMSKKKGGWLMAALVLFAADTLALAFFTFTIVNEPASNIVDFIIHAWAVWELAAAIRAEKKLKKAASASDCYAGPEF